jgi:prepilin-type N-terminal cleavage/methylation domain-containing protein/prepilin-type processing-associated H-X9-DG protein
MRSKQGQAGFTIVELLVVISVVAILASLLLPSLAAAKAKAQSAQCKSNLRQIAMAQALYVTDLGAYPFSDGDWFSLLGPYGGEVGPDFYYQDKPLLWCPSARYGGPETQHQLWDYGYNASGFTPQLMGQQALMGLADNWSPDDPSNKPVREVDVLNPCNMIAFSDSAAKFPAEKRLTLGFASIGTVGRTAPGIPNGTALAYQRHVKKFNTAFADSHVGALKVDTLFFSTEDQDRRRWFRDDQPHREWIE